MELCVLGRVSVVVDGTEHVLGATRAAALLADLVVHAGQVVPAERLIEDLWRGRPPPTAEATLQTYVKKLRQIMEPDRMAGARGGVVQTVRPGYLLHVPPAALDAERAEQLITEGRAAMAGGDANTASDRLSAALGLWQGPAFGALADEDYLRNEATRLAELRLVAIETRAEAELALGRHHDLCGELECVVADDPFRERLWRHWILALYRAGRQADALLAYQRVRCLLDEELGIEPGQDLRNLEQAILL